MQASICIIPYTLYERLRPESVSIYSQYHPRRARIVLARILCSYPFSEYAILSARMCADAHMNIYTFACICPRVEKGRKGCTTVLTSVQGGTWPLAVGTEGRDEGVIRVERTCLLVCLFPTSGFIFLRFAATLSLSSGKFSPGEIKGKCGNVPQPLTSLFRNALISVASEKEKEIRDIGNNMSEIQATRDDDYVKNILKSQDVTGTYNRNSSKK